MRTVLFLLIACYLSPARAADDLRIILDWFVNPDHGPIVIADRLGYFEEAGLAVEIIAPADPADPPKMVAAGRADLAISYQPQLHLQVRAGLPLVRVGTLVATPLTCLLVAADGPVESPADLAGRRVGYSVSGVQHVLLQAMLNHHGLALDDVEMINVNFALSPALMSGQVDAVIGAFRNFELNQMRLSGAEGRCIYPEEEGVPAYDELIYVARRDGFDADVVARFLAATERATHYIVNRPNVAWEIFAASAAELDSPLNAAAWRDTVARFALRPAALDSGRYERMDRFLRQGGLVEGEVAVDRIAVDVGR